MKLTASHGLFHAFDALACRLSPENLNCDGEITRAEARSRYNQIMREWRTLEKQIGFSVSLADVETIQVKDFVNRYC